MLLHILRLDLTSGKHHIGGSSTCAETALALREVTLLEVLQEAIQENAGRDLTGDREERYPSVIVTWSLVALSLVDVDDGAIFELLWEGLTFPGVWTALLAFEGEMRHLTWTPQQGWLQYH